MEKASKDDPTAKKGSSRSKFSKIAKNKAIARKLTEAQNLCSAAKLRAILSPAFKAHISDEAHPLDREQYIEGVKTSHRTFSGLKFKIDEIIAEGEKVVMRIKARGKHIGEYQGIAATQKQVKFAGIAIRRIKDGQVVEEWQCNDQLSLLQQIGMLS